MKTGCKTRVVLLLMFIILQSVLIGSAFANLRFQVTCLNNDQDWSANYTNYPNKGIRIQMMTHEIIGIEFKARYINTSTTTPHGMEFKFDQRVGMPDFVEGWVDYYDVIPPSNEIVRINTVFIRPRSAVSDSFIVEIWIHTGISEDGGVIGYRNRYHVIIEATDLDTTQFRPPVLDVSPDHFSNDPAIPAFSRGYSNVIDWTLGRGGSDVTRIVQDVYIFDVRDRLNLIRSVQGLYKAGDADDRRRSPFQGLEHGLTYGYFAKALYETADDTVTLYSDLFYSTQDAIPPNRVRDPNVIVEGDEGRVFVWWFPVADGLSGVERYRIFRAVDTGPEILVDSMEVDNQQPDSLTWRDQIEPDRTYYYRIRAVDRVGNEGGGDMTDAVRSLDGINAFPPFNDGSEIAEYEKTGGDFFPFRSGVVDTLWVRLRGWEDSLRFHVVRDDSSFFENPPAIGLRSFDSGWIRSDSLPADPSDNDLRYWIFDYTWSEPPGTRFDPNFVNGHTYHRRVIRKSVSGFADTTRLSSVIPDCYPPEDIYNLRIGATITDPNFDDLAAGYSNWLFELSWEPAFDGVSGLRRYSVYRRVEGVDLDFVEMEIPPETYTQNAYYETYDPPEEGTRNRMITYRVASEDSVGNRRSVEETIWEVTERPLVGPECVFTDIDPAVMLLVGQDTLFTREDSVDFAVTRFDLTDVEDYVVSLNGTIVPFEDRGQGRLTIPLPPAEDVEISRISVRAIYKGARSSVWSQPKTVIHESLRSPVLVQAWNDTIGWEGNITLEWTRPSLDAVMYEIWRQDKANDSTLVGTLASRDSVMIWTDYYGIDELSGQPGDTLVTFREYQYRIRKRNVFDTPSRFSNRMSEYCNRPPDIKVSETERRNSRDAILIHWNRVQPSDAEGSWTTNVLVSIDSISNVVYDSRDLQTDVIDDTTFIFGENVRVGYNYIFQVREIPEIPIDRISGWSRPFTVSLARIDSLFIQSQPGGAIFLSWEEDTLIDKLPVDEFELLRVTGEDTLSLMLSNTVTSYMDERDLTHGQQYTYTVYAMNDLNQILALNTVSGFSDTGDVFIPSVIYASSIYFHSDTLHVAWEWKDIEGNPLTVGNRGADSLRIQMSVSDRFPDNERNTILTDWFPSGPSDAEHRSRGVRIPMAVDVNNDRVYCRITAKDRWEHPDVIEWSETVLFIYDSIYPLSVSNFAFDSVKAYYATPDVIIVTFEWEDPNQQFNNRLFSNVDRFLVESSFGGIEEVVGTIDAAAGTIQYTFIDTVSNRDYMWRVVSIDSAENRTHGDWNRSDRFIATPDPPVPTGFKSCTIDRLETEADSLNYCIEIAMQSDHFRLAYEMGDLAIDRILCRSGWIQSSDFICTTGWGAVVTDTTWFRIKARRGQGWESGWSRFSIFTPEGGGIPDKESDDAEEAIPLSFEVSRNYPNPFNAHTTIEYQIPETGHVRIEIYNILGTVVATLFDEERPAGFYTQTWDGKDEIGRNAASGIYFLRVQVETGSGKVFHKLNKMMLVQ